eukprot:CAMPEP_0184514338 /NCGR_PEP_ID=MMETSP0198_2-20121128/3912_1 /TAXON_ID=1112570 /ORGANISM="Thraustochytrium sp., Strain LLF1b" /LENGTH=281 /DNA_ID=CAMNT_0026904525 /DNA_START=264 /DNA_END=1109 /DNA_ORIENTATION=+
MKRMIQKRVSKVISPRPNAQATPATSGRPRDNSNASSLTTGSREMWRNSGKMLVGSLTRSTRSLSKKSKSLKRHSSGAVGYLKNKISPSKRSSTTAKQESYLDVSSRPHRSSDSNPMHTGPARHVRPPVAPPRRTKAKAVQETSSAAVDRRIRRRKELREARFVETLQRKRAQEAGELAPPGSRAMRRKSSMSSISSNSSRRSHGAADMKPVLALHLKGQGSSHAVTLAHRSSLARKHTEDEEEVLDDEEAEYYEQEMEYRMKRKSMKTKTLHYVYDYDSL